MADPGNPSEFSPAELDRLEDALELWTGDEFASVPEDSSLPAPLRARLGEYREVLNLSREALALEDVPDDLLASVLAEAHASAASAPLPDARAPAGPSLWERLRRSLLLPGVALAGSTALLLWMVQPGERAEQSIAELSAERAAPNAAPTPARLTPGDGPAPAAPAEPAPAASINVEEGAKADASAAPEAMAPVEDAALDRKDIASPKLEPKSASKAGRRKDDLADAAELEVLPGLDGTPTQDADKEALRDTLEQADTHRRGGRCDAAMALYEQAFAMSGPADERARARAGYGLCLASQGEDGKADKYFEYAAKLSPGVDGWIARERGEGAYTKKSRAKPSPAKAKMADR